MFIPRFNDQYFKFKCIPLIEMSTNIILEGLKLILEWWTFTEALKSLAVSCQTTKLSNTLRMEFIEFKITDVSPYYKIHSTKITYLKKNIKVRADGCLLIQKYIFA